MEDTMSASVIFYRAIFVCNSYLISISDTIFDGGKWLWNPANNKGTNKDAKI